MIPFAILSGKIKTKTDEKEIRILELSPDSFTFRLLKNQARAFEASLKEVGQQNTIELSFFQFAKREYKELILDCDKDIEEINIRKPDTEVECENESKKENKSNSQNDSELDLLAELLLEIVIHVKNKDYSSYAEQLNREYMNYIYLKLDKTEANLSKALVGYPAEKEQIYSESLEEQRKVWDAKSKPYKQKTCGQDIKSVSDHQKTCKKQSNICDFDLGIELDHPAWYRAYLDNSLTDFIELYWKSSGISSSHPLTKKKIQYLYIGNAYCPHLFPKEKQLYQLLEKAIADQICPVLVFAPVEEKDIIKIEQLLESLSNWCIAENRKLELVINDWGMAGLIRQKQKHPFLLTLGCLLSKQRRDTRIHYINEIAKQDSLTDEKELAKEDTTQFGQGPIQTTFYQNYLNKHFGIRRVSFQSCGYHQQIPSPESGISTTIHFPFFQMNTSGWCPLLASLHRGNRARQTAVTSCNLECMSYAFEYPDFLKMTGRYNTIFGYDDSILKQLEADKVDCKTNSIVNTVSPVNEAINANRTEKEKSPIRLVAGFLNHPIPSSI